MQKCLYLICPTDCLETTINTTFSCDNYFYTSLGNSFVLNSKTIHYIRQIIDNQCINKIYFVLSMDNKIILDALGNQCFSDIQGMGNFYNEITRQKERSELTVKGSSHNFALLSFYLNNKINELHLQLHNLSNKLTIGGKIYNRRQNTFVDIYSDLICLDKYHLN